MTEKKVKFVPLNNNLLIERDVIDDEKTLGGIVIPREGRSSPSTAQVLAVSSHIEDIRVGDKIVVGDFSGSTVTFNDEEFTIVKYEDVLGVCR